MKLPADFKDLLAALNAANVEYVLVGAYAMAYYGLPRFTGDLDILYKPSSENVQKLLKALNTFGFSGGFTAESLLEPDMVHYFGRPPLRVDLLNSISGLMCDEILVSRKIIETENLQIPVIGFKQLIQNKRASARSKDLADLELLEKMDQNQS